jgi:2,5-diamino-6-(ribosylamino)-4(3H)-pyrimidinone 5'-phosphate reductase
MLPRVLVHTAVSADGRTTGFDVDMGQFYGVVADWGADCMLTGADTILQAPEYEPDDPSAPAPEVGPSEAHRLAVVDARGRVRNWRTLKGYTQFWRDPLALVSRATPHEYIDEVRRAGCDALVAGDERVDLRAALELLAAEYGVARVRVDSGGALIGALLGVGLVHEISLMVYPLLAGGADEHTFNRLVGPDGLLATAPSPALALVGADTLAGGVVRLRYEVAAAD